MWAVIKDGTVMVVTGYKPSATDLATRSETSVECDSIVTPGYTYDGTNFIAPAAPMVTEWTDEEKLLNPIRVQRDALLLYSDRFMLSDYPTGDLSRDEWASKVQTYRQKLRDFPANCDPANPVWPTL